MYKNETLYRLFSHYLVSKKIGLTSISSEKTFIDMEKVRLDEEANNLFSGNSKFRSVLKLQIQFNENLS